MHRSKQSNPYGFTSSHKWDEIVHGDLDTDLSKYINDSSSRRLFVVAQHTVHVEQHYKDFPPLTSKWCFLNIFLFNLDASFHHQSSQENESFQSESKLCLKLSQKRALLIDHLFRRRRLLEEALTVRSLPEKLCWSSTNGPSFGVGLARLIIIGPQNYTNIRGITKIFSTKLLLLTCIVRIYLDRLSSGADLHHFCQWCREVPP